MAKKKTRGSGRQFDLERYLKKTKSKWEEAAERAKENKGGFAEYDDGRYVFKLIKAEANQSQANRPQVVCSWKFMDGDYKGQTYKSYRGIDTADNMYYFLLDAKRLGYEIDEFDTDDLPDLLKQMSKDKPIISGSLRSKGEYQNLLINKVVDEDEVDEDDEEDEEDEPKKKKKSKSKKDDDEDDDEEEEEDEDDEDEKPRRKKKSSKKDDDEEDEDEEEDEDDEEEDEKPRKKKSKSRKSKSDDDEDEEDDEDEDDEEDEPKRKKRKKKSDDDDEEDDEDESDDDDEVAVTVGSIVKVKLKAGTQKAEVVEVLEDDQAVKVKTKEGKTVKVSADKIISVEPPKKKKRRK